ncbi:tyrosine-type recombinase/integrase [Limosilactobacillus fermentum]
MLAHGADLSLVQQLIGHQSILTTQVYLEQAKEGHHADRLP